MKNLQNYTSLGSLSLASVQMDKDFEAKKITLDQLLEFNNQCIEYFYKNRK